MDTRMQFKLGFMQVCQQHGLRTPAQILDVAEKLAAALTTKEAAVPILGEALNTLSSGLSWAVPVALAAPPLLGYAGGQLAAKGMDLDDTDIRELHQREIIDELQRQTARLRSRAQTTSTEQNRPAARPLI